MLRGLNSRRMVAVDLAMRKAWLLLDGTELCEDNLRMVAGWSAWRRVTGPSWQSVTRERVEALRPRQLEGGAGCRMNVMLRTAMRKSQGGLSDGRLEFTAFLLYGIDAKRRRHRDCGPEPELRIACRVELLSNPAMKLSQIQAMVAVADAGSIRSAAQVLGKTQSALTKQIRQVEEETGIALFLRTSRGVIPTDAGKAVLSRARSIQAELIHLDDEVAALRGTNTGAVRVSAAPLVAVNVLPRAVARFGCTFPDVDITISSDMFGDALKALREGQHDIVIGPHAGPAKAGDIERETLLTTEVVVITSAAAPHAAATSLGDLTNCHWAMMGDAAGNPKQRFQEQFKRHGLPVPRIRLASESRLGLLALVRELDAVCTFPAPLLNELGPYSGIVRIPVQESLRPLTISMVTRAGKSLTPAAEHFADCVRHRSGVLRREWGDQNPSA